MYKKRNNNADTSRTAWRRRRSSQATQLKVCEHVLGALPGVLMPLRKMNIKLQQVEQ